MRRIFESRSLIFLVFICGGTLTAQDSSESIKRTVYVGATFNPTVGFGAHVNYWWFDYLSSDLIIESVYEANSFPQFAFGISLYPIRIVQLQVFYGRPMIAHDASFTPNYSYGFIIVGLIPLGGSDSPFTFSLGAGQVYLIDTDYKPYLYSPAQNQGNNSKRLSKDETVFQIGVGYYF